MHADDEPFGSVHRVEMFNRFPALAQITDNVGIMNRAATQDVRSPVWPVVSRVLRTATAPSPRDQQTLDLEGELVIGLRDDHRARPRPLPGRRAGDQEKRGTRARSDGCGA